jgi:hypothetical protein
MGSDADDDIPPRLAASDGDDLPPTGAEARAQRRRPFMPLLWMVLGLLTILIFAALLGWRFGYGPSPAPANAPGGRAPLSSPAAPGPAPSKLP